jgi:hypothetical protein
LITRKDVAAMLGRTPRFVGDMARGGFRLPCTPASVIAWLRKHPAPTRFRYKPRAKRKIT